LLRLPVAQFDGIEGRSVKFITQRSSLEWLATVLALALGFFVYPIEQRGQSAR